MNTETMRILLGYGYAFFVTIAAFWFLYSALLDINTAAVPEEQLTVIVTGSFGLVNLVAGAVVATIASAQATRAAERSAAAGAEAALRTPGPPTPTASPTAFVCDYHGLSFDTREQYDEHIATHEE